MLREDVVVTNKVSQNLHAEMLLRQMGKRVWRGWIGCGGYAGWCGSFW